MRLENVKFGSDAEFFIATLTGEVIPAIGMVGGTKEEPKPLGKGYYIQEDNVAIEYNIPPATSTRAFAKNIVTGFNKCVDHLPVAVTPIVKPSHSFASVFLNNPKAQEFGCEPDINAWTRRVNPRPRAENPNLRSCGGHVHISWNNPDIETRFDLIKACDVFVSIPALFEDHDLERRKLYGKAGAMRIKDYGVEHRVLSNYWIADLETAQTVADRYQNAVNFLNYGHSVAREDDEAVVKAINENNLEVAQKMHNKYIAILVAAQRAKKNVL